MQAKQKNKNWYLQNAIKMFKANSLIMKKYLHFYQKEWSIRQYKNLIIMNAKSIKYYSLLMPMFNWKVILSNSQLKMICHHFKIQLNKSKPKVLKFKQRDNFKIMG